MSLAVNVLTNTTKISHITKKETISKSALPRMKKKYDKSPAIYILQVFWDSLSCWQSKSVLKRGFLNICLTTSLEVFNFENTLVVTVVHINGGTKPKPQYKRSKFLNLLVLVHLKNYFIEALNKFLRCFEINGLRNLKLTILRFLHGFSIYIYYFNSSKSFFIVKTP